MGSREKEERTQITLNGLTLHYTVQGQGRPALLVHGHAAAGNVWQRLVTGYLDQGYRCYAPDLPGHGDSTKPPLDWYSLENFRATLVSFCQALDLTGLTLVGHSLGGMLSLDLALARPDLVERLVLAAPAVDGGYLAALDPLLRRLDGLARRPLAETLLRLHRRLPLLAWPGGLNTYAHPRMLASQSFRLARTNLGRCTAQSLFGTLKAIRRTDLSDRLAGLQPPALVITGAQDRVVPHAQAELVASRAPRARLVVIPGAGHLVMDEQPELFDAAVQAYLGLNHSNSRGPG